CLQTTHWPWTF
nr:immunoglobulin light chain junction region [Macaca mulatta]